VSLRRASRNDPLIGQQESRARPPTSSAAKRLGEDRPAVVGKTQLRRVTAVLAATLCVVWICGTGQTLAKQERGEPRSDVEEVLTRLEAKMSTMRTLKTNFVQEKRIALLMEPLVLRGTICMERPALFAWHVNEPLRYSMVIRGDVLSQWDEDTGQVQRISLAKHAAFKIIIRQMRSWFSGDYKEILEEYRVAILEQDPLSLVFTPRDDTLVRQVVESVRIVFESGERYIRQIDIAERGGDSTKLTLSDTMVNGPIEPSAWTLEQSVR